MTEETDGILILKSFWWSNNHDGDMLTAKIEKMPIFKRRRERRRNWICTTNHPPDPYFQKAIISILLQHFILVTVDFYRMKSIPFLNCVFISFISQSLNDLAHRVVILHSMCRTWAESMQPRWRCSTHIINLAVCAICIGIHHQTSAKMAFHRGDSHTWPTW